MNFHTTVLFCQLQRVSVKFFATLTQDDTVDIMEKMK